MYKRSLLLLITFMTSHIVHAKVVMEDRHVVMIQAGIEVVWGHYLFAVHNDSRNELSYESELLLPKETSDFQPQEGLLPKDLSLAESGNVKIRTNVPSTTKLLGIAFKVESDSRPVKLSFQAPYDIRELKILYPLNSIQLVGEGFEESGPVQLRERQMNSMTRSRIQAGETFEIQVAGVPSGRGPYYKLGFALAAFLLLGASILTYKSGAAAGRKV